MSPRAMTRYRSGIVTIHGDRSGPCVGCGVHQAHHRAFTAVASEAEALRASWKAEPIRCRTCAREHVRAMAGVL